MNNSRSIFGVIADRIEAGHKLLPAATRYSVFGYEARETATEFQGVVTSANLWGKYIVGALGYIPVTVRVKSPPVGQTGDEANFSGKEYPTFLVQRNGFDHSKLLLRPEDHKAASLWLQAHLYQVHQAFRKHTKRRAFMSTMPELIPFVKYLNESYDCTAEEAIGILRELDQYNDVPQHVDSGSI